MFPTTTTQPSAPGSTPVTPAQNTPGTPEYLTKDEFNRSAAYIRGLSEKLDSLTKAVPTMDVFVTLGLLDKADDGTYKPKGAPMQQAAHPQNTPEPEWKQAIDGLKKSLKAKEDELAAERQHATEVEKRNAVVSALAKAGAVNADRDAVHILPGIHRNDQGHYISRSKDDLGLDVEISLDEFLGKFLQQNPELKKASSHPGSGTPTGATASGTKAINRDQLSPEFYAKNRDKIVSGEIQIM